MGFRFWRKIKIAPGVTLNLSKSGGSLSFGPRGAKFAVGSRGKRATVGLPGTGLFYTSTFPSGKRTTQKERRSRDYVPNVRPEDRLTLGFFKRLITPDDEEAFVDGCRELALGNEDGAFNHLRKAIHLADGAYLAGFLAFKKEMLEEAEQHLDTAYENYRKLGTYFSKYGISATMSLPITDEVSAHVGPDVRGILLALVEIYQRKEQWKDALECLDKLRRLEPEDTVVKLSVAEILMEARGNDANVCRRVVRLAEGIENESEIHVALLLYKAKALRKLHLNEAARDVLAQTLRRKKDRSEELLRALRYERALVYEDLGQHERARSEFEKLYAEAPDYEDVAARLGLL
jgi:tetratricopeptide (TPR) repeat protein